MKGLLILLFVFTMGIVQAQEVLDRENVIMPVFPGCESMQSNESRQTCFSKKFTAEIEKKLNRKELNKFYNKMGMSKVHIMFQYTISDMGKIGELKLLNAKNGGNEHELFKYVRTAVSEINHEFKIEPAKVGDNNGRVVLTENFLYTVD